jgi:hypothetical protein
MNGPGEVERLLQRLAGRRAQARAAILFERVWPAIWPALGVAGLFVVVALLDIPRMLPAIRAGGWFAVARPVGRAPAGRDGGGSAA